MKKILSALLLLCVALSASADLEIVKGSFRNVNAGNKSLTESDMGSRNMTEKVVDWKYDNDGEDVNALLVVWFENMTPEDIEATTITRLSNQKMPSFSETHDMSEDGTTGSALTRWFYIPEHNSPFDIDIKNPRLGTTRLTVDKMEKHNIYGVVIRASGMTPVTVTSVPPGAQVFFDNKKVGVTPLTIPDVAFGKHSISLTAPDNAISQSVNSHVVDVSATSATFSYDMLRKKPVTFQAVPAGAQLTLTRNGKEVARGTGKMVLSDLSYGTYKVIGYLNGEKSETVVDVTANTPAVCEIRVVPSRSISFRAIQNNSPVDADLNIDGSYVGRTPITHNLNFGTYKVDMSYHGYHKSGRIKVGRNTDTSYQLILPNRQRSRHNPFDIDYTKREWGIAFNYVNRTYKFKSNGYTTDYDFWLREGKHEHGFQMGITYQPYFGYGQGLNTGIYWQMMIGGIDFDDGDHAIYTENSLFVPLQYQFRLPLSETISLFLNAGVGMDIGFYHDMQFDGDDESYDLGYGENEDYNLLFPGMWDFSWVFGGGVQFGCVQLEAKWKKGMTNHDHVYDPLEGAKESFKQSTWTVGISFVF